MATCYPKGNERALFNITYTTLTSTAIVARKRIKHGLLLKIDLISCEVRVDEKTGDESVLFLTPVSLSTTAGFSVSRTIGRVKTGQRKARSSFWFLWDVYSSVQLWLSQYFRYEHKRPHKHSITVTVRARLAEWRMRSFLVWVCTCVCF